MSEARIDSISNESNTGGPVLSGITEFSGQQYFIPPSGTTAERPSDCPPGSIRFNTDSAHLEYWNGLVWLEFEASSNELGGGTGSNTGTGHRGFQAGGYTPNRRDEIDFITISTLGNSQDFGNLSLARYGLKCCASRTRGLNMGGSGSPLFNTIDYITIASTGDAVNFGDLTGSNRSELASSFSNSTRGIATGGSSSVDIIDYVTIAQTGNAVDFGNLSVARGHSNGCSNVVRGVTFGGEGSPAFVDTIDYVTISTTGNAQDFGNLSAIRRGVAAVSNSTRGISAGGDNPLNVLNIIEFITFSSTGNAQDFGDLTVARGHSFAGMSSPIRGVFGSGYTVTTDMDYISIQSTGNAIDFGDTTQFFNRGGSSNGHGGL
jgi:hypothetical protein